MAVCNLCDGNPYNAIWHDCGGCDKNDFCEDCGEHVSECECERCDECDELIENCECDDECD